MLEYGLYHTCDVGYRQCFSLFTGYIDSGVCISYFMELYVLFSNDSWAKLMIICGHTESHAAVNWVYLELSQIVVVSDRSLGQAFNTLPPRSTEL